MIRVEPAGYVVYSSSIMCYIKFLHMKIGPIVFGPNIIMWASLGGSFYTFYLQMSFISFS